MEFIRYLHKVGGLYSSESFVQLCKDLAVDPRGGYNRIRFSELVQEQLCPNQLEQQVSKADCGPLLLALKAQNTQAVKDLLANDSLVNLREALRGPKEYYQQDGKAVETWQYKFIFKEE